jgi:hypothetical protein
MTDELAALQSRRDTLTKQISSLQAQLSQVEKQIAETHEATPYAALPCATCADSDAAYAMNAVMQGYANGRPVALSPSGLPWNCCQMRAKIVQRRSPEVIQA